MDVHEIKSGLMHLTKTDLKEIKKVCEILIARGGDVSEELETLYDVLILSLNKRELNPASIHILRANKRETFNKLEELAEMLFSWMREVEIKKKMEQKLMLHILSEMVIDAIDAASLPVNLNTMIAFFTKAPSLFENQFPGYIDSGTVLFLINSRRAKDV